MKGLEGKLGRVYVGDIIILKDTQDGLIVAGYVHKRGTKKVKLAVRHPYNEAVSSRFLAWIHIGGKGAARNYKLKYFDDFDILRRRDQ